MKFSSKEEQILLGVAVIVGLYDYFTIPFSSLLVALFFAIVLYVLTDSTFLVALVLIIPQFIKMINMVIGPKEGLSNPTNVNKLITSMTSKYSQGHNDEMGIEGYQNALEISSRVENLMKNVQPKAEVSGIIDDSPPTGVYPIEGNPSYPKFNEETMGTSIDSHTGIYTASEGSVPVTGTVESNPKQNPYVPNFDTIGLSAALARSSGATNASNIKAV